MQDTGPRAPRGIPRACRGPPPGILSADGQGTHGGSLPDAGEKNTGFFRSRGPSARPHTGPGGVPVPPTRPQTLTVQGLCVAHICESCPSRGTASCTLSPLVCLTNLKRETQRDQTASSRRRAVQNKLGNTHSDTNTPSPQEDKCHNI